MIKLNIVLASLLLLCALGLVTSQHKARKLFSELTHEQEVARQIDVEWGQLQLEQSTWAMHARIEKIASSHLHMRVPSAVRVRVVSGAAGRYLAAAPESRASTVDRPRQDGARVKDPADPRLKP
jgi:cell division protein FtsL